VSIEKIKVESQQELEQMVTREIGQVEKDLNVICNHVPINDKTMLDVLCHDPNGQLVILQIGVNEDDIMLLHGIQSLDYVDKFKSFLKATYNKHRIDDNEKPRLILVAPGFSDALKRAVESMNGIRIDLYEWEYLKLGDNKGLRLQPVFAFPPPEIPREEPRPAEKKEPKHEPRPTKKKEPASSYEKAEPEPEPLKLEPEVSKDEFPQPPPPPEEIPSEEEQPKRRLKLF
jgi:hypothetical protein